MTKEEAVPLRLTDEERNFQALNRATYNSGKMSQAHEQAAAFYARNPGSLFAKFLYAAMSGDYADDLTLPEARRRELSATARGLIKEVYEDKNLPRCEFYSHARNEYFWFHQLHEEQYALGEERVARGELRGYYSMCVGASAMAKKILTVERDRPGAEAWAAKAAAAFREFEKLDPNWYNINHFYAYALAVLGDMQGAIAAYEDMYRKQKAEVDEAQLKHFIAEAEKIASLRAVQRKLP